MLVSDEDDDELVEVLELVEVTELNEEFGLTKRLWLVGVPRLVEVEETEGSEGVGFPNDGEVVVAWGLGVARGSTPVLVGFG